MPTRYRRSNAPDQSTIPPGELAIVLADLSSGCHSPALNGHFLLHTSHPTELSELRDVWIAALCEYGNNISCWYRFDINYDGEPVFHNDRKRQRQGNGKRQRRRATISTLTQDAAEAAP